MSTDKDQPPKPNKRKGLIVKIALGIALLGAGGGGAFALLAAGVVGGGHGEEDTIPELVLKGESDPYAPPAGKGETGGTALVHGDGGSKYRTAYFTFTDAFTSNLRGSDVLVQVSLAASTRRDGRVLMWLKEHELAVQSRILVELANTSAEEIETPEGKAALQQRLTGAINAVLEEQEGFGGVDNVLFRSLIVQ
ncbi:MAG: flagellar basal body-associated FliL family protein [Porphyrobacter sp.]|nr:flagellar basal body-associated FliL family protein [Porphyrobacter sp.]